MKKAQMQGLARGLTVFCIALLALTSANAISENPPPQKKVLKLAFRAAETGFDPQRVQDRYSAGICEDIYESFLTYDWLARPVKLVPQVVDEVPVAEEGGTRYTFHVTPGIYFADDPAFKGKRREMIAADMEYALKRFRDPANRSPYSWLFEDKIVGLDEYVEEVKKGKPFDYKHPIEGIKVTGKYTISIKLKTPDYNFIYYFAMSIVVPVAHEVIEAYANDTHAHPVGTGPYILKEWVRRSKIVLEKNPNYRGTKLDTQYANMNDPWDQGAVKYLAGKTLPLIDRIEVYPIEEEQPRFLAFMNLEHDLMEETPFAYISQVLPNEKLSTAMKKRGVSVYRDEQPEITYDAFNMDDKVVGGYTLEKVAFRRALVLAHDRNQEINIVRRGQAVAASSPAPPDVVGFDAGFAPQDLEYDPARAKALLDMVGYVDKDGDGWRDTPDGKPIVLEYKYQANEMENRQRATLWVKNMKEVGIRMNSVAVQFADLLKDRRVGKFQISGVQWIADYPDAQNFLQLLYGPNTESSNESRFNQPDYNRLYAASLKLPDSPERNKLYHDMNRLAVAYAPWRMGVRRVFHHFINPWVLGYKKHPILYASFKYLDIDVAAQHAAMTH